MINLWLLVKIPCGKNLSSLSSGFLIDREALKKLSDSIDWDTESDRLQDPDLIYPEYYRSQNFHGIKGGYLTSGAAVTYESCN